MNDENKVIFLVGPTAVGKSDVAVELALKIKAEIISADSMQVYRGMDIGTAKLSESERKGVRHHLIDILDVTESYDAAQFQSMAKAAIADIQSRGLSAIVVGGTGMYVRALTRGLFEGPGRDEKLREKLKNEEVEVLYQRLTKVDPKAAQKIHSNDGRRIIRALEIFELTGKPISESQVQWDKDPGIQLIGLNRPREDIYKRCNERVDRMFQQGLIDEVRTLMERGLEKGPTASKAIGYREVLAQLKEGKDPMLVMELVKQKTRNFVKRQETWFRKEPGIQWLELAEKEFPADTVLRVQAALS